MWASAGRSTCGRGASDIEAREGEGKPVMGEQDNDKLFFFFARSTGFEYFPVAPFLL